VVLKDCFLENNEGSLHPFQSGMIYKMHNTNSIFVVTRSASLLTQKSTDEKGNSVISNLETGQRFYTPTNSYGSARQIASCTSEQLVLK
jgi:hypothetical protein